MKSLKEEAKEAFDVLKNKKLTIAFAESLTGGLAAQTLVEIPGASQVFRGSIVAYDAQAKEKVIGVKAKTIQTVGMVSRQTAIEMAEQVLKKFQSDVSLSFTGVAGPDEMENHPAGTVFVGISIKGKKTEVLSLTSQQVGNNRQEIRQKVIAIAFEQLIKSLDDDLNQYSNKKEEKVESYGN